MNRRAAILAVVMAAATWTVVTIGRSDAFQAQPRSGTSRAERDVAPRSPNRAAPDRGSVSRLRESRAAAARAQATPPAGPSGTATTGERIVYVDRGRIELIDDVTLASDVPGILAELPFREGDEVPARGLVARLKDDVPKAALATANKLADADIERQYAEAAYGVAAATVTAAEEANAEVANAVPLIELERLKLDSERARLQIDKALHDQEIADLRADEAQAQLSAYTITAPFDGVVVEAMKQVGEAIRQGDSIARIVSTRRVRVEGFIAVSDFWNVKQGNLVRVQIDPSGLPPEVASRLPQEIVNRRFEGRLVFVDRTVNPISNEIRVWAEVDNPEDLLRGGLPARMTIHPDEMYEDEPPAESDDAAQ